MHQHVQVCKESQALATIPLFGHMKIPQVLLGMGSAALAVAEYQGEVSPKSHKG